MSPSWSRKGQNNNYGGGLLSCYSVADVLFLVSSECLYLFDPSGEILAPSFSSGKDSSSMKTPKGKVYTFKGNIFLLKTISIARAFLNLHMKSNGETAILEMIFPPEM
jgi:hypothetical protein